MVSLLIMSPALRVALSIAVIFEPCSDAAFSRLARSNWTATLRGSRSARISSSSGSYSTEAPTLGSAACRSATATGISWIAVGSCVSTLTNLREQQMRDIKFARFKARGQVFATALHIGKVQLAQIAGFDRCG